MSKDQVIIKAWPDGNEAGFDYQGGVIVYCCLRCYPEETVYNRFPALKGIDITHGFCEHHLALFRASISHS